MSKISKWPDRPPTEKQVIELFIGKSQWANMWRPTFSKATQYFPKMGKWLNGDPDSMTAVELWGIDAKYTLKNLQEWMDNNGKLPKKEIAVAVAIEEKVKSSSSKDKGKASSSSSKDKDKGKGKASSSKDTSEQEKPKKKKKKESEQ
jgi:hypothetical protein